MGKRENLEARPSSASELKRSKRRKMSKAAVSPLPDPIQDEEILEDEDIKVEQEEEIICDGEVEMYSNEEIVEHVDVETADTELDANTNLNETPKSMASSTSRSNSSRGSNTSRKSTNRSLHTTKEVTKEVAKEIVKEAANTSNNTSVVTPGAAPNNKKGKRRRDSGTSSDEERWLTAIESGKLEDVDDEMKKIKDPKLMTARQRAMYERNSDREPTLPGGELLMSLPIGYREREKPQTAEDIQKAILKSQRRKQQADEKREKDKKKTMDRLLKKQESKQRATARNKNIKTSIPIITYINNAQGSFIHLPMGYEFPLKAQVERKPPSVQLCGIPGCDQPKVYNCSKTKMPLCSIFCYRKNVQSAKEIMC